MGEYVFDASPEWIMNTLDTPDIYVEDISWGAITPVCTK